MAIREGEDYSCKPAQLVLTSSIDEATKTEIFTGLDQIKFTDLNLKVIDLSGGGNFTPHFVYL